jgi:hypothetical protein
MPIPGATMPSAKTTAILGRNINYTAEEKQYQHQIQYYLLRRWTMTME